MSEFNLPAPPKTDCAYVYECLREDIMSGRIRPDERIIESYYAQKLGVSRLSFAPEDAMLELLDIQPGAVSVMGLMNDRDRRVRLVVDGDVLRQEYFGCHPCVNTSSMKLRTSDVVDKYIPSTAHEMTVVELTGEE